MNSDSDITQDILLRLLLESVSGADVQSGDRHLTDFMEPELPILGTSSPEEGDPLPEGLGRSGLDSQARFNHDFLDDPIGADPNAIFIPGDLPTVQTHYEALLKRRLKQEIADRPPLFPWERGLQDYPDTLTPSTGSTSIWLDHLQNLQVPGDLPEEVLAELLHHCQRVADQTWQIGRRLVNAVESIFPDQPQTLDYIAGLVSRPAYRSAQTQTLGKVDYATASSQQQVALAMLAAQSIFEALSLTVSAKAPTATRTWLTGAGLLTVTVTARKPHNVQVSVNLPAAGAITLSGSAETLGANRSTPGDLKLTLETAQAGSPSTLEVSLDEHPDSRLRFQIWVETP